MAKRGRAARTAAARAENINNVLILVGGVVDDALRDGAQPDTCCNFTLHTRLQCLIDLVDELREAKLARQRLDMKA